MEKDIKNILSVIAFILLSILLVILANKPQSNINTQENENNASNKQVESKKVIINQTQEEETSMYNEIIENNIYKEYIYYKESGFAYNNVYLPVREENPSSGKIGICQLNTTHEDNLWEQDEKCTSYMENRYGTWEAAYKFHIENGWW